MDKASAKQMELLSEKTPEQRFAMMSDLMDAQFESMRAGIKYYNPAATEAELDELVKERLLETYITRADFHGHPEKVRAHFKKLSV